MKNVSYLCKQLTKGHEKKPDSSPAPKCLGEELPGLQCKDTKIYGTDQTISGKSRLSESHASCGSAP